MDRAILLLLPLQCKPFLSGTSLDAHMLKTLVERDKTAQRKRDSYEICKILAAWMLRREAKDRYLGHTMIPVHDSQGIT